MTAIFLVLIFAGCFAAFGATLLIASQLRAEHVARREDPAAAADAGLFRDDSLSTISVWARILERFDFIDLLQRHLEEAGLSWSPGRLTLLMLLLGAVSMAMLSRLAWLPLWAVLLAGAALTASPYTVVLRFRTRRFVRFQEHFPDSLDSLSRAMRAGHALATAMDIVAAEAEEPVAGELRRTVAEASLGVPWERALAHLSERVPVADVALRGEVAAVAAHGKLTGAILTAMPFAIAAMMMMVNPSYMATLFAFPLGKHLISAALAFLVLGHLAIRRIVHIRM